MWLGVCLLFMSVSIRQVLGFPSGILNCNGMISVTQLSVEANITGLQSFTLFGLPHIICLAASKTCHVFKFCHFQNCLFHVNMLMANLQIPE